MDEVKGVWVPVVTPFAHGRVDYVSYKRLLEFYAAKPVNGIIPLGTTGEGPVLDDEEAEKLVEITLETLNGRMPALFGVGGNDTAKVAKRFAKLGKYGVKGFLSVSPYYSRPEQEGLYSHFKALSEATDREIVIYNIPYRTGRNMENSTILKLAEIKNITGIKDSCGDFRQSMELILNKPAGFNVLTGEDSMFYPVLALGADGGILAAAHFDTETYCDIYRLCREGNFSKALELWNPLCARIPLLFAESNPAPAKYLLKKAGLIASDEVRLPLCGITESLKGKLEAAFALS